MAKSRRAERPEEDPEREERILNEIVVDAYGEDERAIGWHCYLQDRLMFPFAAVCDREREPSPLSVGERVQVMGMADEDTCRHEIFVRVRYGGREKTLAVPLMQLSPAEEVDDDDTREAVEDWRYWMARGYEF